jgi:hypothetical protein
LPNFVGRCSYFQAHFNALTPKCLIRQKNNSLEFQMDVGDETLAIFQLLGLHQWFLFFNSFNFVMLIK